MRSSRRRLVIDTNVLISAAIADVGSVAGLVDHALLHELVILCRASYEEFATRLRKPKFDRYIGFNERQQILITLHAVALWHNDPMPFPGTARCRDPKDNLFIDLALHSQADMLITGDQDLLVLASELRAFGLNVLKPAEALTILQAN